MFKRQTTSLWITIIFYYDFSRIGDSASEGFPAKTGQTTFEKCSKKRKIVKVNRKFQKWRVLITTNDFE